MSIKHGKLGNVNYVLFIQKKKKKPLVNYNTQKSGAHKIKTFAI